MLQTTAGFGGALLLLLAPTGCLGWRLCYGGCLPGLLHGRLAWGWAGQSWHQHTQHSTLRAGGRVWTVRLQA